MNGTVPVCADDQPFLYELFLSIRAEEILSWGFDQRMTEQLLRMQWEGQSQSYRMQFPHAEHRIIVAENTKAGRIIIDRASGELHLVDISLLPDFRNQGIGTQLLRELQQEAIQQNTNIALNVHTSNPARRLYERLGFSVDAGYEVYVQMRWRG